MLRTRWTAALVGLLLVAGILNATSASAVTGRASAALSAATDGRVAFVRGGQIWTIRPDGTGARRLFQAGSSSTPRWSPDGLRIAYLHTVGTSSDLWVMNANGTHRHEVTTVHDATPGDWSPDGLWLVFGSPLRKVRAIAPYGAPIPFVAWEDDPSSLTEYNSMTTPSWSPDGRWIVFTTSTCGITDVCLDVLDTTSSQVTVVDGIGASCCGEGYLAGPVFSRDGAEIAYTVSRGFFDPVPARITAFTFPVAGVELFSSVDGDHQPGFAPAGDRMVFANNVGHASQIFVSATDGTARRLLTAGSQPAWQPRPLPVP